LIAYFLTNISINNYQTPFMYVNVIACQTCAILGDPVYIRINNNTVNSDLTLCYYCRCGNITYHAINSHYATAIH